MGSTSHTNRVFKDRYINQVSKTQFLGGHHVINRVSKTRDVIKKYNFKTMPTNYIVGKMELIPNFGL